MATRPGIELVTIDAGPGLRDSGAALRDGHSTSGTLGIGLGAISRLADFCDLYSVPGHGTALVARFWPAPRDYAVRQAGLVRPIAGETECGDVFGAAETEAGVTGVLCDGLGHGPLAATAATQGVAAVLEDPAAEPAALVERAHRRIAGTRGGAIGVVQVAGAGHQVRGPWQHRGGDPGRRHPPEHALGAGDRWPPGAHDPPVRVPRSGRRGDHPALRRHQQPLGARGRSLD